MTYKNHTNCRVCGSDKLTPYLDLGWLPLSNNLSTTSVGAITSTRYPLKLMLCSHCGLSQLSIVVPPEEMFSHYVYRSGISKGYRDHCKQMAIDLKDKYNFNEDIFHVDIAGNDGTLLRQFKEVIGHTHLLSVDPAKNLVPIGMNGSAGCDQYGIQYYSVFWNMKAATHLKSVNYCFNLITATNVFAHIDNVKEFLQAVKLVLKPNGILVMEFPYLIDFIEKNEFDTIYFEHCSYFSIYPLTLLCQSCGLEVISVEKQDIHGGSVRVTIGTGQPDETVRGFVINERARYNRIEKYNQFADDVYISMLAFRQFMLNHSNVAGFACSAKGNTLLNCTGITNELMKYIVDETPEKIGMFSPGTGIEVVPIEILKSGPPDYLVILSWNFSDEIISKCRDAGYKGKFVIPIPKLTIID